MLSRSVVLLMDGDSGVDNFRGDGLLVDNWLDSLMNVVVNVLALNAWCGSCCMSGLVRMGGVLKLSSFSLQSLANFMVVAVVEFLVDDRLHLVMMLLREDFLMLDRLDCCVVVVLVDLTVDGLGELLMAGGLDVLVRDSCGDALGDIGGMASLASEACDCGLCFLHLVVR